MSESMLLDCVSRTLETAVRFAPRDDRTALAAEARVADAVAFLLVVVAVAAARSRFTPADEDLARALDRRDRGAVFELGEIELFERGREVLRSATWHLLAPRAGVPVAVDAPHADERHLQ
jgi:hypothetical protein